MTLVETGFGKVADTFFRTVADDGRTGAELSVWVDGKPVVDLWSGIADERSGRAFAFDTPMVTFSCTKGMASVLVAMLMERGALPALDTPTVDIWPEFGAHGKDRITIGDALAHRAGLSAPRRDLTIEEVLDNELMADAIAVQEPLWAPGEHHQYHAVTHGAITGKLVALATGRPIRDCFAELIARPLKAEAWIGLPDTEVPRVAHVVTDTLEGEPPKGDPESIAWMERAIDLGCGITFDKFNEPRFHRAGIAGVTGIATANALARIWSATVTTTNGVRLIGDSTMEALREVRSEGPPFFADPPPYQRWGAGVMVPSDWDRYLSPSSFGHDGAGGQVAFADVDAKVGFAYLTNRMADDWDLGKRVTAALADALG
ncbi:serine hydrolase domain-containing protein [Streptomyces sp. NPDC005373]|uniref:serine hydrolase domain-containing protein n=1 Tax=Streptomyces sp. NPDC005373 TaxID=3156879 RepID=UPI0033B3E80D